MSPHKLTLKLLLCLLLASEVAAAQQRKPPAGGRVAIVVDERLAALRSTPQLSGTLVKRLSRGRMVAVRTYRTTPDGIVFCLVNTSTRTHGWIQRDALISASHRGDDHRLLDLINASEGFDQITRA